MNQASASIRLYFIIFTSLLLLSACATAPEVSEEPSTSSDTPSESNVVPPELIEQIEFLELIPPEDTSMAAEAEDEPVIPSSLDRRIASDSAIDSSSIVESLASAQAAEEAAAREAAAQAAREAAAQAAREAAVQAAREAAAQAAREAAAQAAEEAAAQAEANKNATKDANISLEQLLVEAEAALARSDYQKLRTNLARVQLVRANPEQQVRWRILQARLALLDDDLVGAQTYLSLDSSVLRSVGRKWQVHWFSARADYYAQSGDRGLALKLRIEMDRRLQAEERIANQRDLVVLLQGSSIELLEVLASETQIQPNVGWYELGKVLVANQDSLILRSIALNAWRQNWFTHPASVNLDKLLVMESDPSGNIINNIGVILPLSGQFALFGEAVQTGINLAATEYVFQTGRVAPQISYFDSATAAVTQLYSQAINGGAQLVIGPLLKQGIADVNKVGLSTPMLALNYLDEDTAQSKLFQLGISVRDDVRFVSEAAWGAGCLNALVLYADSEWSRKAFDDFNRHWNRLGGIVLDSAQVSKEANLARIISRLVQVDDAQVEQAKSFFNRELNASEYEEFRSLGRRSDAECLLLLVSDDQARLIRPLLAFYLANDLVIYGTSRINRPEFGREQNKDLDGIYWSDIPWLSSLSSTRKRLQLEPRYNTLRAYERLVALGVDAFNIFPYLTQLRANSDLVVQATTGELRLTEGQQIRRTPELMRFIDGDLTIVP